ncbi:hypothetical protein G1H11_15855 [Phytoactinopolyspora alkaliphila]|uniref:Transcriptional regulator n=1 Tax=Phytoactinopolyspora alkaliphila TaxID=1783498 RepID=A0A6N9YP78_9ACTN|nr:hypothetical protein [Phytoactinopolyspora alkaliphila]NED96784.1 hypothetical protein [Phytoactinopolyspora alkaliphila]
MNDDASPPAELPARSASAGEHLAQVRAPVTIGVVGPPDVVQSILSLDTAAGGNVRLVGAAHHADSELLARALTVSEQADIILFTGPLQYDLAADQLPIPSTFVPISGTSLFSALIRGTARPDIEMERISIDSISVAEVREAYADIGRDSSELHIAPYDGPASVDGFGRFHAELYWSGATTAAFTTVKSVANRLEAEGIPAVRMAPTTANLRNAVVTSALMGTGSLLEEAQLVLMTVHVTSPEGSGHWGWSNYRLQGARLAVHQLLLEEVEAAGAALLAYEGMTFGITATAGALRQLTDNLHTAPFVDRLQAALGLRAFVGIGSGRTVQEADANAQRALGLAQSHAGHPAQVVGADGAVVGLPPRSRRRERVIADDKYSHERELLRRIIMALPDTEPEPLIVDAARVAEALSITLRSGRRILNSLVAAGLAWTMPPAPSPGGGRPRQRFRLLVQRLEPR